jgi:Reverse transcriptase (RNA-dependent DNA polymerase)
VFIVKHNPEGKVDRLKARLVVKGYTQTYDIDYEEAFAPVTKMNTVCTLISYAVNFGWNIDQLDVNNAFFHMDFKEEMYMELHPGFDNEQVADKVCRLKCSLYGLKQSPRAWFDKFLKAMIKEGYLQSNADHTMFIRRKGGKLCSYSVCR